MRKIHLLLAMLLFAACALAQPTFTSSFPPDITVQCDAVPPVQIPVATSPCAGNVIVQFSEVINISNFCPQEKFIKRIFTATDNCTWVTTKTQTITVIDTKAPSITFIAPLLVGKKNNDTIVLNCFNPPIFDASAAYATDNCDVAVPVVFKDNLVVLGDCKKDGFLMIMSCSWIATDACGNKTEVVLYFKIIDDTPPSITGVPKDVTVSCENINNYTGFQPVIKDGCASAPVIKYTETIVASGVCPHNYKMIRKWTATDDCGNIASATQTITVEDKKPPVLSGKPQDLTINFGQNIPKPPVLTAVDNCTKSVKITGIITRAMLGCDSVITYKCIAEDECGNVASASQKITVLMPKPIAGTLKTDSSSYCLPLSGQVTVTLTEVVKSSFTTGYTKIYLLVDKTNGAILQTSATPSFSINKIGDFSFHTLIYSSSFDLTKAKNVSDILASTTCLAFDKTGVSIGLKVCPKDDVPACTPPNLNGAIIKNTTCGKADATITLVSNANFTYKWSNTATTPVLDQLNAGTYTVTVALVNDANCKTIQTFTVGNSDAPLVSTPTISPTKCGQNNGEAIFPDNTFTYIWFDGKKVDQRKDLAAGVYYVTATINNCVKIISFEIKNSGKLDIDANAIKHADCGQPNGAATLNVLAGSGDYSYSWGNGKTQVNLNAGIYNVTVTDNVSKCKGVASFAINGLDKDTATVSLSVDNAKCPSDFAKLNATIVYSSNFVKPATIKVTDLQGKVFDQNKLPTGFYVYQIFNGNNCLSNTTFFQVKNPDLAVVVLDIIEKDCKGEVAISVKGGTAPYSFDWADLPGTNDPKNRQNLSPGTYKVTITDANNCPLNTSFDISKKTCDTVVIVPCKSFITPKSVDLTTKDCINGAELCLDLSPSQIANLDIFDNNQPYNFTPKPCGNDTTFAYSYLIFPDTAKIGPYVVQSWNLNGKIITGQFKDIQHLVDSMNLWNPGGNWKLNASKFQIEGGNTKNIYGKITVKQLKGVGVATVEPLILLNPKGTLFTFKVGYHNVVFTDKKTGCKDTLLVKVACKKDTIPPSKATYITKKLCVPDSLDFCFDSSQLTAPVTLVDLCKNKNYKSISYTFNKLCIGIKAIGEGKDTICAYLCDAKNKCDTTYIVVEVCKKMLVSKIDTISKDLCAGKSTSVCVGKVSVGDIKTIKNLMPADFYADFTIIPKFNCIEIAGKNLGNAKALIEVCSAKSCDTTLLLINVKNCEDTTNNVKKLPIAIKDTISTLADIPVLIKPLINDTINGTLVDMGFLIKPKKGDVTLNADKSVTYTPEFKFCGGIDTFTYFIQNQYGKDTATVCVNVTCTTFVIYDGFSPNGDGINETFVIKGIEQFEDNIVTIFNRWGNVVYQKKDYKNIDGWDGSWNGEKLPDGTYWYKIELPRIYKVYAGYVFIRR